MTPEPRAAGVEPGAAEPGKKSASSNARHGARQDSGRRVVGPEGPPALGTRNRGQRLGSQEELAARLAQVPRKEERLPPFVLDDALRLARVLLFFGEVDQRDVGALAGVEDRHGASDPGVASRDERDATRELSRRAIVGRLEFRQWLDARLDSRRLLVLLGEGRLRLPCLL